MVHQAVEAGATFFDTAEQSMRRLGTVRVDIVLLHNPPAECLDGHRTLHFEVLERVRCEGKIRE